MGHKIHPFLSTNSVSEATMVVSGFGPYHRLVQDDAPTEHTGVILTPWAMPLALDFGHESYGGRVARATTITMRVSDFKVSTSMHSLP